ncbi:hemerythrin domain-containing protein [Micromonospora coxensis]|uniref:Hemerythrin HHE cation binding domain-containing protein n=1 Tax=Micromonospora coxensis TaxID=356852 RepID=A0A1C5K146_9ACTN|nr:hemerythrin domain-containing protein [Micromonospora coxensis]SCG76503.1 Hemerythrin HHE cation binding domain-containing protein [Micromonospora coxensis]
MPDTDAPATPGPQEDVVDLLLAQHARIEQLFLLVIGSTRRDAFDDLVKLLAAHETAEEEVVHPLARTLPGGGGDAMVDERLDEERQAKETLKTLIAGGVDADGFDVGIILLRDAVLTHARYEERYEFPRLRQHVPADRLRSLATAVRAAEATAPTRPHPRAQTAKGNLAAGPALAVIDRVRDAVRKPSKS